MALRLDPTINYIVSGLERSGTSMLMQILDKGEIPTSFDDARPPDEANPKGYYELAGGKIINQLIDGIFPFERFQGSFIKITCYGLKFLPVGRYKILYSERNIEEILSSMEKMADIADTDRDETRTVFIKLNTMIKKTISERTDCDVLFVNYNKILSNPKEEIQRIIDFIDVPGVNRVAMVNAIDTKLYRQRHQPKT
ncbi:MAG: sulfotransferase domain-containing protein [Candidatus Thermoplasmatota archaeon]|nr:sulfotransferase domain-containing protein [Candidatus Thermoplasmatota archaeon]